jgi:hypothetical protein
MPLIRDGDRNRSVRLPRDRQFHVSLRLPEALCMHVTTGILWNWETSLLVLLLAYLWGPVIVHGAPRKASFDILLHHINEAHRCKV